jgi:hypothetical protein
MYCAVLEIVGAVGAIVSWVQLYVAIEEMFPAESVDFTRIE